MYLLGITIITAVMAARGLGSISIPFPSYRMEVSHEGHCIDLFLPTCSKPEHCETTLKIKLVPTYGASPVSSSSGILSVTPDNASYVMCIYNLLAVNASCCKYSSSHSLGSRLSEYDYISFNTKMCTVNTSVSSCNTEVGWNTFVLPSKNLCNLRKPCLNGGRCSAGPNTYNCSCTYGLEGKNCDGISGYGRPYTYNLPKGFSKMNNTCLNTTEQIKNITGQNVNYCGLQCKAYDGCKSMEFRRSPGSDNGVCILRKVDRKSIQTKSCDFDYFQPDKQIPVDPTSGVSMATSGKSVLAVLMTVVLLVYV